MADIKRNFRSESSMDIYDEFKQIEEEQNRDYDNMGLYQNDYDFRARMVQANSLGIAQAIIADRNREIEMLKEELASSNSRYIRKADHVRESFVQLMEKEKARRDAEVKREKIDVAYDNAVAKYKPLISEEEE